MKPLQSTKPKLNQTIITSFYSTWEASVLLVHPVGLLAVHPAGLRTFFLFLAHFELPGGTKAILPVSMAIINTETVLVFLLI